MIESISKSGKKYRISPTNPKMVQIQYASGKQWVDYNRRDSAEGATALVLELGRKGDETEELEAVRE